MELSFLRPLYERPGPYASVYVDMTRANEEVPKGPELRWRALREDLTGQGAAPETVRAVDAAVQQELDRRWSGGLAVFAAGGEVVLSERLLTAPDRPLAHVGHLPHVLPLLAQRGEQIPHLVAVVDRTGADISCVSATGERKDFDVRGDAEHPIRKVSAGDWNQSRFQRAAEENWRTNAKKVGHEVELAVRRFDAELVVIAGDVRARTAVIEELPGPLLERSAEAGNAARAHGGAPETLDAEIARLVELRTAEHLTAAVARFEEERGHRRRAAEGLGPVCTALRRGQVDTLLLEDQPDEVARLWVGPDPTHVAVLGDDLRALGVSDITEDRADAALIRALAATD